MSARDTDVFLLLLPYLNHITYTVLLWVGTSKKFKYIPVSKISENLPQGAEKEFLQFHAITGSDTTSCICDHSKMTSWKFFEENFELLLSLGDGYLATGTIKCAEVFMCKLHKVTVESVDKAR